MARYEFTKREYRKMAKYNGKVIVARDSDSNEILGVFKDMAEFRSIFPGAEIVGNDWDYETMIIWC